jgi:acyl-CoA synthetase (AMP-forming)/AMP-acid ligase II
LQNWPNKIALVISINSLNSINEWFILLLFSSQVDGITDRSITYSQLRDKCRAFAIHLRKSFKLKANETIAVCLPNSIEFPIITLGGIEAEIVVTTVNPTYTSRKLEISHNTPKIMSLIR